MPKPHLILCTATLGYLLAAPYGRADDGAAPAAGDTDSAQLFNQVDRNADGQIADDEVDDEHKRLFKRLVRLADKDGDGKLSKDEFVAGLKEAENPTPGESATDGVPGGVEQGNAKALFERLDANTDGKVVLDEIPAGQRERFTRLLERADRDSDGALTLDEFQTVANAVRQLGRQAAGGSEAFFKRLDANGDGKIVLDEVPEQAKERVATLLQRADRDGDKALSREEFAMAQQNAGRPAATGATAPQIGPPGQPGGPGPFSMIRALDTNGDGTLSADEIAAAAESLKKLDKNGDGSLTRDEFLPGGQFGGAAGGQNLEQRLAQLMRGDANGDGKLSREELPQFMRQNFERFDSDADGLVDADELKKAVDAMRARFRQDGPPRERLKPDGQPQS